jgi:aconitate hydratase
MARLGGDPKKINPQVPVDLVIDHSVQVDRFGSAGALLFNSEREFVRNRERYEFLKWGKEAFKNFTVVPPATGIVHQVNLEYLGKVVMTKPEGEGTVAYPDSLVGTDSHTTMINGLGILGWGVGGIEAEAVMLGQPIYMLTPEVIGVKLTGRLPEGATATDLVLVVTELLRQTGVVGKFVEYFGPGLRTMSLADRATIANMCPEYGATVGFFPVDDETLNYMRKTGRPDELVSLVEQYCKAQGLFHTPGMPDPDFTDMVELDLSTVLPSLAGPKRPQDRILLSDMKKRYRETLLAPAGPQGVGLPEEMLDKTAVVSNGTDVEIGHGAVVIAAITSCTNTSNPSVMLGAGLAPLKKRINARLHVAI